MADPSVVANQTGISSAVPLTVKDYKSQAEPIWCPGCGDFGVLSALYQAFVKLKLPPKDILLVSGIGCSGRLPHFVSTMGFHVVHGRALPVAMGVKLAKPDLHVIVAGGDGDGFGIGGGHIPHIARRNCNLTYIVMDNSTYGLTKGQVSPTSPFGHTSGSTPYGSYEEPLNPIAMSITYGATFVARTFSGKLQEMIDIYVRAIQHKGFALVDVLSPCVTFYNTYKEWAARIAPLPADHHPKDRMKALEWAFRSDKIWTGVFYDVERPTYEELTLKNVSRAEQAGRQKLEEIMEKYD